MTKYTPAEVIALLNQWAAACDLCGSVNGSCVLCETDAAQ